MHLMGGRLERASGPERPGGCAMWRVAALAAVILLVAGCASSVPTLAPTPTAPATPVAEVAPPLLPSPSPSPSSSPSPVPCLPVLPTSTPSPGATTVPPSAPPPSTVYVVVAGDSLWGIGQRHGLTVDELLTANPQITDRDLIHVGDQITLVGAQPAASSSVAPPAWSIIDLGSPLGGTAYPLQVNDRGEVLVRAYAPSSNLGQGFLWHDGVLTDLGTLGGPSTVPWAMNDRGQVVGYSLTSSRVRDTFVQHAFLWQDGVMRDLGTLGPYGSEALAVNNAGQVVGEFGAASGHGHAFLWQDGAMTDLGTLGGGYARAETINEAGQVAGVSWTASKDTDAFRWQDGRMTDLGLIGPQGHILGIDERGRVVGNRSTGAEMQAFIWQDGLMRDLGTLGGPIRNATSMNTLGQVVGRSQLAQSGWHAFLWADGVMSDLATATASSFTDAEAINDRGQVVGANPGPSGHTHAVLVQHGVMTDLGSLGGDSSAVGINEQCMAVGTSTDNAGVEHAVMWTAKC